MVDLVLEKQKEYLDALRKQEEVIKEKFAVKSRELKDIQKELDLIEAQKEAFKSIERKLAYVEQKKRQRERVREERLLKKQKEKEKEKEVKEVKEIKEVPDSVRGPTVTP